MKPVYIEKKDRVGKKTAKAAFRKFIGQNPATYGAEFSVETAEIYELVRVCRDTVEEAVEVTAAKRARLA
jgi:hypothetical protein